MSSFGIILNLKDISIFHVKINNLSSLIYLKFILLSLGINKQIAQKNLEL